MFSPYYAWRGRRDPYDHCALNVAIYGERRRRWAMTERPAASTSIGEEGLELGSSAMSWDGDALTIAFDEVAVPLPRRLRGRVRVIPDTLQLSGFNLDGARRHLWWPIAPSARIEVELDAPHLSWAGSGYLDCNRGDEPLEKAFSDWQWSRAPTSRGALVHYELRERSGARRTLSLSLGKHGIEETGVGPVSQLPLTKWRIPRRMYADAGAAPEIVRTLEDGPFYARSLVAARIEGRQTLAVHESLSLDRFALPVVKCMLPFRMPRRVWPSRVPPASTGAGRKGGAP